MAGSVQIDGLEFNGVSRYGSCSATLTGWWERPDTKGQSVPVENGDGDLDLPVWNAPRYVTVEGLMRAKSHDDMHEWMDRVNGLLQGNGQFAGDQQAGGRLQVMGHGGPRWAPVKWNAATDLVTHTDALVSYQLKLKSNRPQKFGNVQVLTIPASLSYTDVFHRGNTVSYPVLVVSGSAGGGYTIRTVGGTTYTVTRALASGTPHTIDMRTGRLMVGGAYVSGGVSSAGIIRVWAGSTVPVRIQPLTTGSPVMTVTTLDTFI